MAVHTSLLSIDLSQLLNPHTALSLKMVREPIFVDITLHYYAPCNNMKKNLVSSPSSLAIQHHVPSALLPLPRSIQMPPKHLLPDTLAIPLDHIAVTRHNPLKPPPINPRHTLIKPLPIPTTRAIPNDSFLPLRLPRRTLQRAEDLRQHPALRIHARLAELLGGRQVEHHVCLYERLGGPVVENEFLVNVPRHVFPVELGVKFRRDGGDGLVFAEHEGEGHVFVALLLALFGQGFGAQDLCGRVRGVPGAEEDVVLGKEC
jgi:hypothetical protein